MKNPSEISVLVVGASGATGRLLVQQLLDRGHHVRIVVRNPGTLPESLRTHDRLSSVTASLLELDDSQFLELARGCSAVASCLGHNLTFRGIFGAPRQLVTEATRRLCEAIRQGQSPKPVRFVLMNTTGNRNRDLDEPVSFAQKCVVGLLRILLPPHRDNEDAADYLRVNVGQKDPSIEWCAVRPDGLIDEDAVSAYELHPSPTRSAIFDAGKTSRINVANLMARLATEEELWKDWRGQMPVIYNTSR